ncbi:ABC transporter ATP-binding protein/permease [Staphylococcus gallinarum]|uniref:ABC transporter ATP-binding protein n=1 Tax=Staphylococcus gallinarum TaxID=1293 RepID=UPI002DBFC933|nr:ABC transporter ATP-binding protein [Staphylococcus gallinarum]MEB6243533.1 ABC transporter ATP-binding protein/permease [Staphylococcus gallinarum]MEB6296573.1 ABC transporter ATP-binding protein/permease [Staphylococcus gallinarum]
MTFIPIIAIYMFQLFINNLVYTKNLKQSLTILAIFVCIEVFSLVFGPIIEFISAKIQKMSILGTETMILKKTSTVRYEMLENSEFYSDLERFTQEGASKPFDLYKTSVSITTSLLLLFNSIVYIFMINKYYSIIIILLTMFSMFFLNKISDEQFKIKWDRAEDERKSWYIKYISTHDFGFKELFSYRLFSHFRSIYISFEKKFIKQDLYLLKKLNILNIIYELVVLLVNMFLILSVVKNILKGTSSIGILTSISSLQQNMQASIKNIVQDLYTLRYDKKMVIKLNEFLINTNLNRRSVSGLDIQTLEEISLKNLSYSYGDSYLLKDINLNFYKGTNTAIVGKNGAGKSTMIKILSQLYETYEGNIYINKNDIKNYNLTSFLKKVSILYQDFLKYEFTVKDNIGLGHIENIEDIENIEKVKNEYCNNINTINLDTQLGNWFDKGHQLSGGQWQRIAIARTLMNKQSELILLDEPSSALDLESENQLFSNLMNFVNENNKIGIFVSHRIASIKKANQIIVLEKGQVVGVGSHDSLLKNCSQYKKLLREENLNG